MKKTIFFVLLLFILAGTVAASEDVNITEDLSADDSQIIVNDTLQSTPEVELEENESSTDSSADTEPEITASDVSGTAGKDITLKATVSGVSENTTVTFTLNGQTYTAKTDASGTASVSVNCPPTAEAKTTTKESGKTATVTTTYSKTYTASVSVENITKSFTVTSVKPNTVTKYKLISKSKTKSIKLKNGAKKYKITKNYKLTTYKTLKKSRVYIAVGLKDKKAKQYIEFKIKEHYKKPAGKWKWTKWTKVTAKNIYCTKFIKNVKVNKIKIKYTVSSWKKV